MALGKEHELDEQGSDEPAEGVERPDDARVAGSQFAAQVGDVFLGGEIVRSGNAARSGPALFPRSRLARPGARRKGRWTLGCL